MIYPDLESVEISGLVERFARPSQFVPDDEVPLFLGEVAMAFRRQFGAAGADFLLSQLPTADVVRTEAVLIALTSHEPIASKILLEFLEASLEHSDPNLVAAAVRSLARLGVRNLATTVMALRHSADVQIRRSVVEYMGMVMGEPSVPQIIESLADPAWQVRHEAIEQLEELDAAEALPAIIPLVNDPAPEVREEAREAIRWFDPAPTIFDARGFTTRKVLNGSRPIVGVVHELNGDWQFLDGEVVSVEEGVAVHAMHLFEAHPTIAVLADLPKGWEAWWEAGAWRREQFSAE